MSKICRNSKIHDCQPILENYRHWFLNIKSKICYIIIISSGKKYAELHPKKEEKKEKKAKEEKPKQEKAKQEKPKKQEKKKEEPEEEDDVPPPPKFVDPYAGLPKRYS